MTLCGYLNVVSPHQIPLARALVEHLGPSNFRYIYIEHERRERIAMGWSASDDLPSWCVPIVGNVRILENADVLYSGVREIELFERRARAGKKTFYYSERWFKPVEICFGRWFRCLVPGWVRMFGPNYRKMARRFVHWLNTDPNARYLAVGPWAAKDMLWLGVKHDKIVPWGYYVEPRNLAGHAQGVIRLLWVGRLLRWKRVDDIVRAVHAHDRLKRANDSLPKITLDIYGRGAEELRLRRMVAKYELDDLVKLHPSVPIAEVRRLMHKHDVYVLSSDACEGWGAVVSEALEEGMKVIGTYEAGASATMLPKSNLYHAGDWRRLARLIGSDIPRVDIGEWTAKGAAQRMLALCPPV